MCKQPLNSWTKNQFFYHYINKSSKNKKIVYNQMHLSFKTVGPTPSASKLYKPSHIWFMYWENTQKGIFNVVHYMNEY